MPNDVNNYVKRLKSFMSLYGAMQSCFEISDISLILGENFKIFFEKLEKYFSSINKTDNETILKQ